MKTTDIEIKIETPGAGQDGRDDEAEPTMEQAFAALEQLVSRMESGQVPLEQSFELYRQGMELIRFCNRKIDRVEKQLLVVDEGAAEQKTATDRTSPGRGAAELN